MKFVISTLMLLFTLNSFAQKADCEEMKTGIFVYTDIKPNVVIKRTDNQQIEINKASGLEIHSSIEWISDCEYVLTFEEVKNHPRDVSNAMGNQLNYKILSVLGNQVEMLVTGGTHEIRLTFKKVKDQLFIESTK